MYKGKPVNICIPTLNNYSGLNDMLDSIDNGTVVPETYHIIDNGFGYTRASDRVIVHNFNKNLGVAGSWNWFIQNVSEYRIILNDDLYFFDDTLEKFLDQISETEMTIVQNIADLNAFSFFSLPDSLVSAVGLFDEQFYPAYFEDNDYAERMLLASRPAVVAKDFNVIHRGSQTIKHYTDAELQQHHRNFRKNRDYFKRKWGKLP